MSLGDGQAVLFVGANRAQAVAMRIAAELGFHTVATDRSAAACGAADADTFAAIDATDVGAVIALARGVHRRTPIVGAQGVADFAFPAVGAVHEALGLQRLPGPAVYRRMTDKTMTKASLRSAGVPVPTGIEGSADRAPAAAIQALREVPQPLLVKPSTGHASKCISRIEHADAVTVERAIVATGTETVLIESEIRGRHFNVDAVMTEGTMHRVMVTERFFAKNGSLRCRWSIHPAKLDRHQDAELFDLAEKAAHTLGYGSGPVTIDMVLAKDGPILLEASPHFHDMRATAELDGGDALRGWFGFLAGRPYPAARSAVVEDCVGACRVFPSHPGVVEGISGLAALHTMEGVIEVSLRKRRGDEVRRDAERCDLCAIVWVRAPDHQVLVRRLQAVEGTLSFEVK